MSPLLSHVTADLRLSTSFTTSDHIYRPCRRRSPSAVLVALLLLGGIELNPDPAALTTSTGVTLGLLNAHSAVHRATLIHDTIADQKLDVLMLTETWITSDAPDARKLDVAPSGFQVVHQPRGSSTDKRGGGVAVIHLDSIAARPVDVGQPSEFEVLATQLTVQPTVHVTVVCIYRPPGAVSQLFRQQLADNNTLSQVAVRSTCFNDHNLVTCCLHVPLHSPTISRCCYRDLYAASTWRRSTVISNSRLCTTSAAPHQSTRTRQLRRAIQQRG